MPYQLPDGRLIAPDVAFTLNDIQYPANFLRLASEEDKAALGIVWVDPGPTWDQRFYWGYDQDGNLIPKDHTQLVEQWAQQTRHTANTLLTPTDWMIIREADNGIPADATIRTWREMVRLASGSKVFEIEATTTTDGLAAYITGPDYPAWPEFPSTDSGASPQNPATV